MQRQQSQSYVLKNDLSDPQQNSKQLKLALSSIRQKQRIRISQDQIILQNEETSNSFQSIVCPICSLVLPTSHISCSNCNNDFCIECIENWWIKSPYTCIFKCQNAKFKIVKRSNTFNTLIKFFKYKCNDCSLIINLSETQQHDKQCTKKLLVCKHLDCGQKIYRQNFDSHLEICEHKIVICQFCKEEMKKSSLSDHQSKQCEQNYDYCEFLDCKQRIKVYQYDNHVNNCLYKILECQWCSSQFFKGDADKHYKQCEKRKQKCIWCKKSFRSMDMANHHLSCSEKQSNCQLCNCSFRDNQMKDHKLSCMFQNMVKIKFQSQELLAENIKLKQKVSDLEYKLQQFKCNRDSYTMESLMKIKQEEQKQLERDLLRINNGMQSLEKLRKTQLEEHMKLPHISHSLCPFCSSIKRKLQEDIEPLSRQKQEVIIRINQIERFKQLQKSQIRSSSIK